MFTYRQWSLVQQSTVRFGARGRKEAASYGALTPLQPWLAEWRRLFWRCVGR